MQTGRSAVEAFGGPYDGDIVPHQSADLVPVVIDHYQLVYVGHFARFPLGEGEFLASPGDGDFLKAVLEGEF